MIIPERRICDFCGKENPEHQNLRIPIKTDCEWTEGRVTQQRIELEAHDICEECLLQATNIYADFQGSNLRISYKGTTIRMESNG